MKDTDENSNLQPDRDIFGFEKPTIATDKVFEPPVKPDLKVVYAGLGIRILAYVLDAVIIIYPLYYLEMAILGEDHNRPDSIYQQLLIDLLFWTLYYAVLESSQWQATLGKRMCKIKVVDEYGNKLSFQKATLRYLAQVISILPLGFGIWAIASDAKKQGWHDMLTGCFVIENEPLGDSETNTTVK